MSDGWARMLGAGVAGLIAASLCIAGVEAIAHRAGSGELLFAAAAAGLGVGAAIGGALAVRIGGRPVLAWIIALLLALLALINVYAFPHPVWFVPAAAAALALGAWIATRAAPRHVVRP